MPDRECKNYNSAGETRRMPMKLDAEFARSEFQRHRSRPAETDLDDWRNVVAEL